MGANQNSGECQSKLAEVFRGLKGVVQIKDNIVVCRCQEEHDVRFWRVLDRLAEYKITLTG